MSSRPLPRARFALLAALLALAGCRNPFMPSSDIYIDSIWGATYSSSEIPLYREDFTTGTGLYEKYATGVVFAVRNKVGVDITSVTLTYTDMAGNAVTSYKATGGKTMKMSARLDPTESAGAESETVIYLQVVDNAVVSQFLDGTFNPKYINCTMTFRGEDDNGYDVKLPATITIKGYGF